MIDSTVTLTCARLAERPYSGDEENKHVNNNIVLFHDIRDALDSVC